MKQFRWFATLALALTPVLGFAETLKENFNKTYAFQPGQRLTLDNTNGAITIEAWDRNEVRIVAVKEVKARDAKHAKEVMAKIQIRVVPSNGGLAISTVTPDIGDTFFEWLAGKSAEANVQYQLSVPRHVNLAIENVNGSVTANDVGGDLKIETVNGRISLARTAGRLELTTVNGRIQAQMRELSVKGTHSIDTVNGSVTLQLPATSRAQLDVKTTNGSIENDFATTIQKSDDHRLLGAINGGGSPLVVRTTNGGVKISKG
jgi:DUF4097 and DUF4098 domain-containing protein YvlB